MPTPLTATPISSQALIASVISPQGGNIVPFIVGPTAFVGRGTILSQTTVTPNVLVGSPA